MAIDVAKYSESLRKLCSEYYCQNITYDEFKQKRSLLLDNMEDELAGREMEGVNEKNNILNAVKTYAKKLNLIE